MSNSSSSLCEMNEFQISREEEESGKKKENVQNVETDVKVGILVDIVVVVYCCCWRRSWSKGLGEEKREFSKSKSLLRTILKG